MRSLCRDLIEYQHGYCYIFAIAVAQLLSRDITLIWDIEATDDDLEPIGEDCLVHAFVALNSSDAVDAGGYHESIQELIDEYPCNTARQETASIADMYRIAKEKDWEVPSKDEIDSLVLFIKEAQYCKSQEVQTL
jgi:hypothetical protein